MTRITLEGSRRHGELRDALLATVDLLYRRRAGDIQEGYIDDYVALKWLEWHGGGLRLTASGNTVWRQLSAQLG